MHTVEKTVIRLPLAKRRLLEELAEAHRLVELTHEEYCEKIEECRKKGLTYGQMGVAVGTFKEGVWRSHRRWLGRKAK